MKPATNAFAGRVVELRAGASHCWSRPSRRTATRWPRVIASDWSCVTYTVVTPRRAWSAAISARIWTRSFASRLESGSSIRNTLGERTIARPIATRCRWPPESWAGLRPSRSESSSSSATSRTRRSRSRLLDAAPSSAGRRCSPRPSGTGRARSSGRPSRRRGPSAARTVTSRSPIQMPRVDLLEPGEHPQRGRLAGAGRPDEDHQLCVLDVEVERIDRGHVGPRIDPRGLLVADVSHGSLPDGARSGRRPAA